MKPISTYLCERVILTRYNIYDPEIAWEAYKRGVLTYLKRKKSSRLIKTMLLRKTCRGS